MGQRRGTTTKAKTMLPTCAIDSFEAWLTGTCVSPTVFKTGATILARRRMTLELL